MEREDEITCCRGLLFAGSLCLGQTVTAKPFGISAKESGKVMKRGKSRTQFVQLLNQI
jgi:hypothetical protein